MKKFPCPLVKKLCEHGGNKRYNYGFVSGAAGYCRYKNKWTSDLENCPLLCEDCMENMPDYPSKLCVVCNAYQEHLDFSPTS